MTKFKVLTLCVVIGADILFGQSILTPPDHATGIVGQDTNFACEVEFEPTLTLSWAFNNDKVYTLQYDIEIYHFDNGKYFVTHDGRTFTLWVKNLEYTDGGKYTCMTALNDTASAVLLVIGEPQLVSLTPNPIEGSTATYICITQFTGPKEEDIPSEHYPKLQMFLDDELLNGAIQKQQLQDGTNFYNFSQTTNITLESHMNGKELMCHFGTSRPLTEVYSIIVVEVLYQVRHTTYTPKQEIYLVGDTINCVADGNPVPSFIWDETENPGNFRQGQSLKITEEMFGNNMWTCKSRNTINGRTYQENIVANFVVLHDEKESRSDSWKIAVGITVPICLVIGCLTALFYYRRCRRSKISIPSKREYTDAEGAESAKPLIDKDATGKQVKDPKQTEINPLVKIIDKLQCEEDCTEEVVEMAQELLPDQTFPTEGPPALRLLKIVKNYFGTDGTSEDMRIQNGNTALHKIASWAHIWKNQPEDVLKVVRSCKSNNSNIDVKNNQNETALHIFTSKADEWKHYTKPFLEIVKCLVSTSNIDFINDKGMTALHMFTTSAGEWKDQAKQFLEVLKYLKSSGNTSLTDTWNKATALHTFISKACDWHHHSDEFLAVIKCLKTSSNIDIANVAGETPLHVFTKWAGNWSQHPEKFYEVLGILKSQGNCHMTNTKYESSLFTFLHKAEWTDQPEVFFKVVNCLKSQANIDIKTRSNKTALHIFTSKASEWYYNPETFLEIVKCLRSASNINIKDMDGATALHLFTSHADEWRDHADKFLEVVRCLTSSVNIFFQTNSKNTALGNFVQCENTWKDHCNNTFFKVVRCLIFYTNDESAAEEASPCELNLWVMHMLKTTDGSFEVLKFLSSPTITRYEQKKEINMLQILRNIFERREGDQSPMPTSGYWQAHYLEVLKCFVSSSKLCTTIIGGDTPLHAFISAGKSWTEYHEVFLDVVKYLISCNSPDAQNADGNTALHLFTNQAHIWKGQSHTFLDVIICLKTTANIEMQNNEGKTALFSFTEKATESLWEDQADTFVKVVDCLISPTNIDLIIQHGTAALHQVVSGVKAWGDYPEIFIQLVHKLKSPTNINYIDKDGDTVLHYLFVPFLNRENLDDFYLEVRRYFRQEYVDVKIELGNEAGHLYTIFVKTGYGYTLDMILEFTKLNLSPNCKLVKRNDGWKEIQIFQSNRKNWEDSPTYFLEVVECLKSSENINFQGEDDDTAIHLFAKCKLKWADSSVTSNIISCLMSQENLSKKNNKGKTPHELLRENFLDGAQ